MGSRITRTPRLVRLSSGLCPSSRVDSPTSAQLLRKPTIKWPRRSTRITSTLSASFCLRRRAVAMPPKPPPRINTRFINSLHETVGATLQSRQIPFSGYAGRPYQMTLIDRQILIYFFCPGIDAAFEIFHLFEARADQQFQPACRAGTRLAENYHIFCRIQFREARRQLTKGDIGCIGEARNFQFMGLAHIHELEVICLHALSKLADGNIPIRASRAFLMVVAWDAAKLFVVDQLFDISIRPADAAVWILLQLHKIKRHIQRVVEQ